MVCKITNNVSTSVTTVRLTLLCGSQTRPIAVDVRRLSVSEHLCLRNMDELCWVHFSSNSQIRFMELHQNRYWWLGHVSHMPAECGSRCRLIAVESSVDPMTKGMEALAIGRTHVVPVRIPSCNSRDPLS